MAMLIGRQERKRMTERGGQYKSVKKSARVLGLGMQKSKDIDEEEQSRMS